MSIEINMMEGQQEPAEAMENNKSMKKIEMPFLVLWNKFAKYLFVALASFGSFCSGCFLSWSSAALPLLQKTNEEGGLQMTAYQGSWVASLLLAGALLGAVTSHRISDRIGRKRILQAASVVMISAWLLIGFSGTVYSIQLGRLLGGLAVGAVSEISPLYVEETSSQSGFREMSAPLCQLQTVAGMLFGYVIGTTQDYVTINATSFCVVFVFFMCFSFLPESPYYTFISIKDDQQLRRERTVNILKSLQKYNDGKDSSTLDSEVERMHACQSNERNREYWTWKEFKMFLMGDKAIARSCAIGVLLMVFQQLSGVSAILFYCVKVFAKSSAFVSPQVSAVLLGGVYACSTAASTLASDRFARRFLLLASSWAMCVCLCSLGVYIHLQPSYDLSGYSHIPLICLAGAVSSHAIGFGPVPFAMAQELYPGEMQNIVKKSAIILHWGLAFGVTKTFRGVMDTIGAGWLFWNFGSCCFFASLFVLFCVPETKNRSLDKIHRILRGKKEASNTNTDKNLYTANGHNVDRNVVDRQQDVESQSDRQDVDGSTVSSSNSETTSCDDENKS